MSIIYTLIILCVLVLVHEFGHFIVAKKAGIMVEEFSIGMGPLLFSWQPGETQYSLRAFPIGGYVRMLGEEDAEADPRAFCNKGILARMAVTFAGPFMNLLVAVVFFLIAFMYFGAPATNGLIGTVAEDSPAAAAGLVPGDVIVSLQVEDTPAARINSWHDISVCMAEAKPGDTVTVGYQRGGETLSAQLVTIASEDGRALLGVTQGIQKANFFGSLKLGFATTVSFTVLVLQSLWEMVTGAAPVEVAGPVGMVSLVGEYADIGLMYLFLFTGMLSVNLGVMNLLPIPALDGARLLFLLVEAVRRKPIDPEKEGFVNMVGFMLLLGLMLVVTYFDITRLIE